MYISYAVSNLAQLQEMIDDIRANARVVRGRKVSDDEIAVMTSEMNCINVVASSKKLTDGSEVFDVEF